LPVYTAQLLMFWQVYLLRTPLRRKFTNCCAEEWYWRDCM
jgi:hypothetical protein